MEGWIKLHRKMLDNPIICKDGDYLSVWIYILLNATHKEMPVLFKGEKIFLKPGQLITGRRSISTNLNISESKITRILKMFENEQQIEQQTCNKNRLISVIKWDEYQDSEQQNEQQLNTNKNVKNVKNEKNAKNIKKDIVEKNSTVNQEIVDYLNVKTSKNYRSTTSKTKTCINARMNEGFTLEDFKTVIDYKSSEWKGTKMQEYLRPETLFGTKFESYLNNAPKKFVKKEFIPVKPKEEEPIIDLWGEDGVDKVN